MHMGMRHRAALCMSEETDAVLLVVSEETGRISLASAASSKPCPQTTCRTAWLPRSTGRCRPA